MARKNAARVDRVSFRSSIEVGPYQHVHVEASAAVPAHQNPSDVVDELKVFVAAELKAAKEGRTPTAKAAARFRDLTR